jgi:glycosyltransferase involved in cell wall biosynthesis
MIKESEAPIVTVIIPVYNTELYLNKCIDSVLNQSLQDVEVLIVNDQSTDNSENIIQEYALRYSAIKTFSTTKKSLAGGSRNIGLQHARGKYIGFVDSDDWIDTNMYLNIVTLLEKSDADIGICGVMKEYESPYDVYHKYNYQIENILEGKFAFQLLARQFNQDLSISPIACNKVYKSSFLKTHNFTFLSNNYNEDDVFNYLCFSKANKVAITPNTFYHYYQRTNSITHSFSQKHMDDLLEAFNEIRKYLEIDKLFKIHKRHYYAYFEKCSAFVFNLLVLNEQSVDAQNKYLQYFFLKSQSSLNISDYLEYCGALRLRNFLNPSPII